jgi:hypothetical protein
MVRTAEYRGVTVQQERRLSRTQETRLAGVSAVLLAAVLGSAAVALAAGPGHAATALASPAAPAAAAGDLTAVDFVPPTPVSISFAKPQPPHVTTHAPAQRATRSIPAAPRPQALRRTSRGCDVTATPEERGSRALASLLHPIPGGISYTYKPGGGALKGMTYYDSHHVDVFVASCARESDALLRHVVAHETGHAWDSLHMTADLRAEYLAARGIPAGTSWFGCDGCQDFSTPAGDFAETYAQWQRGASDSRSTIAPAATPAQLADLGARFFS